MAMGGVREPVVTGKTDSGRHTVAARHFCALASTDASPVAKAPTAAHRSQRGKNVASLKR